MMTSTNRTRAHKVRHLLYATARPVLTAAVMALSISAADAAEKVSLRLKWVNQAQFAGFYVASAKGFYAKEGLELTINPGGPNLNAEALVASGADTFGLTGGVESHLAARDKGLPLVGLGVAHQKTPYGFVAFKESGIAKLPDLKGKKVSTWFTGAQYTLAAVLATANLTDKDVTIAPQSVSMNPFINKEVDVATVTLFNELNVLKSKGLTNLVLFQPDDFGISAQRDTIVTTEAMIKDKPALVQGFLTASLKGWKYALENQKEAIDIVLRVDPSLDRPHQEAMLAVIKDLMVAGKGAEGLGAIDLPTIKKQHDILLANKVMKAPVDLDKAFDASFWTKVSAADKKL